MLEAQIGRIHFLSNEIRKHTILLRQKMQDNTAQHAHILSISPAEMGSAASYLQRFAG